MKSKKKPILTSIIYLIIFILISISPGISSSEELILVCAKQSVKIVHGQPNIDYPKYVVSISDEDFNPDLTATVKIGKVHYGENDYAMAMILDDTEIHGKPIEDDENSIIFMLTIERDTGKSELWISNKQYSYINQAICRKRMF